MKFEYGRNMDPISVWNQGVLVLIGHIDAHMRIKLLPDASSAKREFHIYREVDLLMDSLKQK